MIFEVNRPAMLETVKTVGKIVPTKHHNEIYRGILVESNADEGVIYLTATNPGVSIQQKVSASVTQSGTILVNSRMLENLMSRLEGEFVSVSAEKSEVLKASSERCTVHINCHPSESYPKPLMPFPEECVTITGITSLSKRTVFAVSTDTTQPALQCVQLKLQNNAVHATACDKTRMMLVRDFSEPTDEREFLLPGNAFKLLASISEDSDVFEVSEVGNKIVFVRGDMIFTINKLDTGSYIDTAAIIKNIKPEYEALVDTVKMKEALNLMSVAATAGGIKVPVNIMLTNKDIIIRCNSDYSEAESAVPAKVSKKTPSAGFMYDGLSLLELFKILNGKVKLTIDAKGCMLVKASTEAYFQAPVQNSKARTKETGQSRAKGAKDAIETTAKAA
jgi:DNA polymerase-3 subunit beta